MKNAFSFLIIRYPFCPCYTDDTGWLHPFRLWLKGWNHVFSPFPGHSLFPVVENKAENAWWRNFHHCFIILVSVRLGSFWKPSSSPSFLLSTDCPVKTLIETRGSSRVTQCRSREEMEDREWWGKGMSMKWRVIDNSKESVSSVKR